MKKITKKELNERIKLVKQQCMKTDEKIIYRENVNDNFILSVVKTIDSVGNVWDYTFYNDRDIFDDIKVMKYLYTCDIETHRNIYL